MGTVVLGLEAVVVGSSYRLGVDVGGTFTDAVCLGSGDSIEAIKVLTTYPDPAVGVVAALWALAERLELTPEELTGTIDTIVHGTTVTTNALHVGRLATAGLITSEGFRDSIEMRMGYRSSMYDNRSTAPAPIVRRSLRFGVAGRIGADGTEQSPLDKDGLETAIAGLREAKVEAVAVCFMHSYANPDHERQAVRRLRETFGEKVYVTASSTLLPRIGFYERASTTCVNASAGPLFSDYLTSLAGQLEALGFAGTLLMMQSNGGMVPLAQAAEKACNSLLSGPAGGVVAAQRYAKVRGYRHCLSMDMGGTSFDVCAIENGEALTTVKADIGDYRIAMPMVDIRTIGAGGGSIGWVDSGGLLRVGPASAGSDPGPACCGRGGTRPTVTDANLVLGYLERDSFWNGQLTLDTDAAAEAIRVHVAGPLGCSVEEAAWGIFEVVSVNMTAAARQVTIKRGNDPRDYALILGGGAGPLHASILLDQVRAAEILVPPRSAVLSACGMLMADVRDDLIRTLAGPVAEIDRERLAALAAEMAETGRSRLTVSGWPEARLSFSVALRYTGQLHEIEVPVQGGDLVPGLEAAVAAFHEMHRARHGYAVEDATVELTNVLLSVVHPASWLRPETPVRVPGYRPEPSATRRAWFSGRFQDAIPVFDNASLRPGAAIEGPALVSMADSAIVVDEGTLLRTHSDGAMTLGWATAVSS